MINYLISIWLGVKYWYTYANVYRHNNSEYNNDDGTFGCRTLK